MYYHICPFCGAALDPGEKCDCQDQQHKKAYEGVKDKKDERQKNDSKIMRQKHYVKLFD